MQPNLAAAQSQLVCRNAFLMHLRLALPGIIHKLYGRAAGLIPFIGLAPPVAAYIPLMPPDVLANAALLQVYTAANIEEPVCDRSCDWRQMPDNVVEHLCWTQITYGATIASFLGGIHWGAAMLDPRRKTCRCSTCLM